MDHPRGQVQKKGCLFRGPFWGPLAGQLSQIAPASAAHNFSWLRGSAGAEKRGTVPSGALLLKLAIGPLSVCALVAVDWPTTNAIANPVADGYGACRRLLMEVTREVYEFE